MAQKFFQLIRVTRAFERVQNAGRSGDLRNAILCCLIATGLLSAASVSAQAALECGQVIAVAQTTVKLRDDGVSLNAVLREMDTPELRQKLDAKEINLLRQIVRLSFTSEASPHEIAEACKSGTLGLPKPKPAP